MNNKLDLFNKHDLRKRNKNVWSRVSTLLRESSYSNRSGTRTSICISPRKMLFQLETTWSYSISWNNFLNNSDNSWINTVRYVLLNFLFGTRIYLCKDKYTFSVLCSIYSEIIYTIYNYAITMILCNLCFDWNEFGIKWYDASLVVQLNSINYLRGFLIYVLNHLVWYACNLGVAIIHWTLHVMIQLVITFCLNKECLCFRMLYY
jgi:hypothetical protein